MSCYIRQCQIDDVEDIYQLNKEEMGYDYPIELTAKKIMALCQSSCDRIFVAEESGKVIGYVHANNYDTLYFGHMKNIMGIAVSSLHKRHGIGSLLLAEVEKWAHEDNAIGIRLVSGGMRKVLMNFIVRMVIFTRKNRSILKNIFNI